MKLLVYGDLHVEFAPFEPAAVDADVIVLAGDIGVKLGGLEFAARLARRAPVVYVAGNHEYYRGAMPALTDKLRARARDRGVFFLDNDSATIDGVRFLGCTLWTDFLLFGRERRQECILEARHCMNDYKLIRHSPAYSRLSPNDTIEACNRSTAWLEREIAADPPAVIVTHHAPSARSIPERYATSSLSAAFASNFDGLVEASGARAWIHGHTHHCVDYTIGGTRVVSNQRGYPDERVPGFREDFTITI